MDRKQLILVGIALIILLGAAAALGFMAGRLRSRPAAPSSPADVQRADAAAEPADDEKPLQLAAKKIEGAAVPGGATGGPASGSKSETSPESASGAVADPQQPADEKSDTPAAGATPTTDTQASLEAQKNDLADQAGQKQTAATEKLAGLAAKLPGAEAQKANAAAKPAETSGDTPEAKAAAAKDDGAAEASPTAETPPAAKKAPQVYSVQLGSFVAQSAALSFTASLEPLGYKGELLYAHNHRGSQYFVVQLGDFKTYAEAKTAAKAFAIETEMVAVIVPLPPYELAQMKKPPEDSEAPNQVEPPQKDNNQEPNSAGQPETTGASGNNGPAA